MRTSRRRPVRGSGLSIAETFSLLKLHYSQIQLWGMPWSGSSNVLWVATLETWLLHQVWRGLCFCYCFLFLLLLHRCVSLLGEGILNRVWQIFGSFCMAELCNVFEGGEPACFVLGYWESFWPSGIFRARNVKVHPQQIVPTSPFGRWCLLLDFWVSDPVKFCICGKQWSHCYPGCSCTSRRVTQPLVICLNASISVNTRTGHRFVKSVLFHWQLSPVKISFPYCTTWACLSMTTATAWFPKVRKNVATLLHSGRLSRCMDAGCAVPAAHRPTEVQERSQLQLDSLHKRSLCCLTVELCSDSEGSQGYKTRVL